MTTPRKIYEGFGPSGRMETTATSLKNATNNLRARLHFECKMSWFAANRYDLSPVREVKK